MAEPPAGVLAAVEAAIRAEHKASREFEPDALARAAVTAVAAYVRSLNPAKFLPRHGLEPGAGTAQVLAALSEEITEGSGDG